MPFPQGVGGRTTNPYAEGGTLFQPSPPMPQPFGPTPGQAPTGLEQNIWGPGGPLAPPPPLSLEDMLAQINSFLSQQMPAQPQPQQGLPTPAPQQAPQQAQITMGIPSPTMPPPPVPLTPSVGPEYGPVARETVSQALPLALQEQALQAQQAYYPVAGGIQGGYEQAQAGAGLGWAGLEGLLEQIQRAQGIRGVGWMGQLPTIG